MTEESTPPVAAAAAETDRDPPDEVTALLQLARSEIQRAFAIDLDLSSESLALVDGYMQTELTRAEGGRRQELLNAIGCHFGEVARRQLHGRWVITGPTPTAWRIELIPCFLYFFPVGMAGEALLGCESERYDGAFGTAKELREELDQRLQAAPPLSEAEYYSLCGRLEVLSLVSDWLVARQLTSEAGPRTFDEQDYRSLLD